jgi:drug/metabolite transporter (DMT)-like permease
MKPVDPKSFERNLAEAAARAAVEKRPMIRTVMNRADWLILLVLALIWGAAFFFIRIAVREIPPITYVWARLALATVGLWLFLRWRGIPLQLPRSVWVSMVVLALLNNTIPFVLIGWAETRVASGLAAILNATTPIWGVLFAHVWTRDERLSARKLLGVLLGFIGVGVMVGPALFGSLGGNAVAELACIVGALSYAVAGVWARRFKAMGLPPATVTMGQLAAGALVMLPLALAVDRPWLQPMPSATAVGAVAALALVCTAFAYVLYFRLIDSAGATNALLVTLLVPPVAILLGSLFLSESLAPRDFAGLGLIALGLAAIDGRLFSALGRTRQAA